MDLGVVADATNVNVSIQDGSLPNTYTYNQLIQVGDQLDLLLANGDTVAQELAALGYAENVGVLNYNFPIPGGASGSLDQTSLPITGVSSGQPLPFSVAAVSGTVYPGFDSVGATANLDPTNGVSVFNYLLGGTPRISNNGYPTSSTSTVVASLGIDEAGAGVSAEIETTTWEVAAGGPAAGVPEPAAWSVMILGLFGLGAMLRRRRTAALLMV
ncbi:MAG: PEP-CTERM sorting domain-containing protein [Caulobacteraceae bacterium]